MRLMWFPTQPSLSHARRALLTLAMAATSSLLLWSPGPASAESLQAAPQTPRFSESEVIPGGATHLWNLEIPPFERSLVVIRGEGLSNLSAYLVDDAGAVLAQAEGAGDLLVLQISPGCACPVRLLIVNLGGEADRYVVTVTR